MILARIQRSESYQPHPSQYGGIKDRSTTEALVTLVEKVRDSSQKYVFLLLFDVSKAFDRMWWPAVKIALLEANLPPGMLALVCSFLQDRRACLNEYGAQCVLNVEMGCPQGSVLGPYLWTRLFDQLLVRLADSRLQPLAFVDDLAVLLEGQTKSSIEEQGRQAVAIIEDWCSLVKLQIASSKTVQCQLKGKLNTRSPPVIAIGGNNIRHNSTPKYLGVILEKDLNPSAHTTETVGKALAKFGRTKSLSGVTWGTT
ncbi:hypothetical protein GE061_013253 [Apolygus lucorum]|uniref:Reverse transcriptase domain-containing protein n=1 Tax=Apolygus lucorum TaxID=248454 RepID=A0A8S9XPD0_APOLU|nr:hypothetical protein GE061_013253 [Apolygus lucorum]